MDIFNTLNQINEKGTEALDNLISAGTNLVSGVKAPKKGGFRKAADRVIGDVINKGAVHIPAPTPEIRTGLGFIKSAAGPIGMPFRIGDNQKSNEFYQETVDVGTKTKDGRVVFNQNIKDKEAYDRLGTNLSNKDIGRYSGKINSQGEVIVEDDYNTNNDVNWHMRRVLTGENAEGDPRPVSASGRVISLASAGHKALENFGWTNPRPFGTTVKMGQVQK